MNDGQLLVIALGLWLFVVHGIGGWPLVGVCIIAAFIGYPWGFMK